MDTVLPDEWINRHKHGRIERVLVSRGQVECEDLLSLVLSRLIETVWSLEPIASDQDVEVKRILGARYIVNPVERIAIVPDCMNRMVVLQFFIKIVLHTIAAKHRYKPTKVAHVIYLGYRDNYTPSSR